MMFSTVIMLNALISGAWSVLQCPKCVTTIDFNQSVEVPVTCGRIPGDYCAMAIAMDFQRSEITLDFDRQTMDNVNDALFNRSISYMNYFSLETMNLRINVNIVCSTSDRCAFDLGQRKIRQILSEISLASVWMEVLSKLNDILIAPVGSVALDQCYKPDDAREVCPANSSKCFVEHIMPMKDKPDQWLQRQDTNRWNAGCSSDSSLLNRLTMGYSVIQPSSARTPDYMIFAANCNKTLCNGGASRENVIRLLAKYPTVGGWYDVSSGVSLLSGRWNRSWMFLVIQGLLLIYLFR